MESTMQLLFLVVLLKVIFAQDDDEAALKSFASQLMSPLCKQLPEKEPKECCNIPDLFYPETYEGCMGAEEEEEEEKPKGPITRGSPECAKETCYLRNNDLLFDNNKIDVESVKQYLDEWVAKRKEYMPAVNAAKDNCLGNIPMFGPKEMCDASKLMFCITSNFLSKCPSWQETEDCTALRTFLESCLPYCHPRWPKLIKLAMRYGKIRK
ncbi:uncharacterized protein LOC133522687 isoform X2 [Cydia pomonella]|uniref:uncharacterized protein LOC133522687 isoform X2 n=1 Tax=Cydia pomonella TaxID=82600 RepID=UPI002ADDE2BF|nr:uncharacterized protein LOC133522687 isoform X2 [Cydia pomonella]